MILLMCWRAVGEGRKANLSSCHGEILLLLNQQSGSSWGGGGHTQQVMPSVQGDIVTAEVLSVPPLDQQGKILLGNRTLSCLSLKQ